MAHCTWPNTVIYVCLLYLQSSVFKLRLSFCSYNNESYLETGIDYVNLHQVFRKLMMGYIYTLIRSWQCRLESLNIFIYQCYRIHLCLINTFLQKKLWVTKGEYDTKVMKTYKYIHTCITPFYFQKSIEGVCTMKCKHMHTIQW